MMPRFCLVKQEVYQDLYVCPNRAPFADLLFSSMGRVGPYGLIAELGAAFHILKEANTKECRVWEDVLPGKAGDFRRLKTETLDQLPGQEFKQPGSPDPPGKYAVDAASIDWTRYDIVLSINVSIPKEIVRAYPHTLWCYMIGEANLASQRKAKWGYDVTCNQRARGKVARELGVIDFPYTFLGPETLEKTMRDALGRPSADNGIYAEVNACEGRPVTAPPPLYQEHLGDLGHELRYHQQLIRDNLTELYDSRYFVKVGGRSTRGNSIVEAISAGTIVLMDPDEVEHAELLPPPSHVRSIEQARDVIAMLDANPDARAELLMRQRRRLKRFIFDKPLLSLEQCLYYKRHRKKWWQW